jgi:dTDP-4-amino-4,6-dideoxygalactose transaminase
MTLVATIIPHSRPVIAPEDLRAVEDVLRSGQVAQGPWVDRFEQAMASFFGLSGGVAVSSGTAALELALRALGVGTGDEVILPTYVCAAPWLAIQRVGAVPRLVDIERETFNIDPVAVRTVVAKRTKAIIVPHLFGLAADLRGLVSIGIPLIEDCAQTLGATQEEQAVGTVGTLTVCSFYATKPLCAGEGGMVLSRDESLLDRVRQLRAYDGAQSLDPASFNYKMTDVQAVLGYGQLKRLPQSNERRQSIAHHYLTKLSTKQVVLPSIPARQIHHFFRFVIRLPQLIGQADGLSNMIDKLEQRGLQCRKPVFRPLHRYVNQVGFPVADETDATALSVPLYPDLQDNEVAQVQQILTELLA